MTWLTSVEFWAWALVVVAYVIAAAGSILPGIPGAILVFLAASVHAILVPGVFTWISLTALFLLALASWFSDLIATWLGARIGGSTVMGLWGASLGGLFGALWGLPGMIVGPFVGAILGDLIANRRRILELLRSGLGASFGYLIAIFSRVIILGLMGIVILMVVLF